MLKLQRAKVRSPSLDPSFGRDLPRRRGATYPLFFDNLIVLKKKVLQTAPAEDIRFPLTAFANTDSNIAKRKRKPDVDASDPSKLITWRPNFEEFISRLRHKACLDIVKKNKGEECVAVLRAMLNVKSAEEKVEKGQSGRMSVGSFSKEVKTEDGHPLLQEIVVECLGKLSSSSSSSSSSLPAFVIEMDGSYRVDFESIISVPRYHEMKAAVKRTYGEEFSQMFNYLLEKEDCLFETSEIVGAVEIEEEAALRGLFDMRKGGYVRMEV
ncbi:unnamed protein product [Arabidopsis lyrata]|nr:unnamed protein product [Arabidopsis lyrata]